MKKKGISQKNEGRRSHKVRLVSRGFEGDEEIEAEDATYSKEIKNGFSHYRELYMNRNVNLWM